MSLIWLTVCVMAFQLISFQLHQIHGTESTEDRQDIVWLDGSYSVSHNLKATERRSG